MNLQIINPITYPGWDELLLSNPDYSFFHSSSWASVLYESYHYKPLYFTLVNENKLLVLIPVMEVKSFLTGKRGVSLPFTDYCDPIIAENIYPGRKKAVPCGQGKKYIARVESNDSPEFANTAYSHGTLDCLTEYGRQAGWEFIEIRGGKGIFQDIAHSSFYYGHTLDLSQNEEQVFSNFRDSAKRNIRKALREGIKVNVCNSLESIKEFYRLNCMTRKIHGLPPQPYYFFKKIYDYVISKNLGIVVLASYKGKTIAGAVYFHLGEKVIYKYGASDVTYQQLRANNLVMWEAVKRYCQNGYKNLCFGRTEPEHKGLRQFKAGWGAEEHLIKYYRYDLKRGVFTNGASHVTGRYNKAFHNMPVPMLRIIGALFYKYMG